MKFCKNCGFGMDDAAEICTNCESAMNAENTMSDDKLKTLSERIKINGIIWIVIGVLQIFSCIFSIVGILNIVSGVQDLKTSKNVFTYRVGLVDAYTPVVRPIITLVYNAVFGGIVGIIGSLYYLFGIRGFVLDNKDYFNAIK